MLKATVDDLIGAAHGALIENRNSKFENQRLALDRRASKMKISPCQSSPKVSKES
jgi:hypothetical protein